MGKPLITRSAICVSGLSEEDRKRVTEALSASSADAFKRAFLPAFDQSLDPDWESQWIELADFAIPVYMGFCALANRAALSDPETLAAYEAYRARLVGRKGGNASAAVTRQVRDEAVRLAKALEPDGGWRSAPVAAEAIAGDLVPYAKARGRNPSRRKVEEWLRTVGIKRRKHTQ